ncbi:hypothetical protein BDR04DRAFT_380193 [Suillus decipiens]|nr:hypothetical protein BDR04DRAFT_380193 [Suillus decipiens]
MATFASQITRNDNSTSEKSQTSHLISVTIMIHASGCKEVERLPCHRCLTITRCHWNVAQRIKYGSLKYRDITKASLLISSLRCVQRALRYRTWHLQLTCEVDSAAHTQSLSNYDTTHCRCSTFERFPEAFISVIVASPSNTRFSSLSPEHSEEAGTSF